LHGRADRSIIAGARRNQSGIATVLGGNISDARYRAAVCPRIAYMPQGLGKNLYPDLSVRENIELFGRLFGQPRDERGWRIAELLDSTGLAPLKIGRRRSCPEACATVSTSCSAAAGGGN
jgi:ribosome-dependent ATPase